MNYRENESAYVVNWQDMSGKSHQDEIVKVGFYDNDSRSWTHSWDNVKNGLDHFINPLPKVNTVVYKLSEYRSFLGIDLAGVTPSIILKGLNSLN